MTAKFSLLVLHEGYTTTLGILERGFMHLKSESNVDFRIVELSATEPIQINSNEIPLFVRCVTPTALSLAEVCNENGVPFVYYLDDDFQSIDLATPLGQFYRSPIISTCLERIIALAATIIVNSEILGRRIKKYNSNLKVLPGYFDFSILETVAPPITNFESEKIRIGFASNLSREKDLKKIERVLETILLEYPDCELDLIGLTSKRLSENQSVNVYPHFDSYTQYIEFQVSRNWYVGLAPLSSTKQNLAKTNNKYREYSAMSIPGIYSPLAPYAEVIDGVTGVFAGDSADDWLYAIRRLLDNGRLRSDIALNAFKDVSQKYGIQEVMGSWLNIFQSISDSTGRATVAWTYSEEPIRVSRLKTLIFVAKVEGHKAVIRAIRNRIRVSWLRFSSGAK